MHVSGLNRGRKIILVVGPILLLSILVLMPQNEKTDTPLPITSLSDNNIKDKSRLLGIDINEIPDSDYATSITEVKEIGIDFVQLTLFWDGLEPTPNQYNDEILELIEWYYPSEDVSLIMVINPVDTGKSRVVSDLLDRSLDDPQTISRFNKMIDHVYDKIPHVKLTALAIGNEIDGYLGHHEKWGEYERFYSKVTEHIKSKERWKEVPIGTKATFYGITEKYSEEIRSINDYSDVVMVTHYPLNSDFTFRVPTDIHTDMNLVVKQSYGKPIFFMEMGYSSGSTVNSSPDKQKEFIIEVFDAWDENIEHVKAINFVWMHDLSSADTQYYNEYYGISDSNFSDYLATLGLKYNNGEPKPAWIALKEEAAKRGWGKQ